MYSDPNYIPVIDRPDIVDRRSLDDINEFIDQFCKETGGQPNFVVRAPGRVNLIGDHVDYHGFSVLPMAIRNCILIGLSIEELPVGRQGGISIANRWCESYRPFHGKHSLSYGSELDKSHEWYNYVLCGYHGVLAKKFPLDDQALDAKSLPDLQLFVDGDLPMASGLSSSSALVCASAIATRIFLEAYEQQTTDCDISKIDVKSMAADCSKFENLVGTNGGGMDQAVILTAQEGYAKHVQFTPEFKCNNVQLPEDAIWLVSQADKKCHKAPTSYFNTRVLETKLGAAIILKTLCPSSEDLNLDHTITLAQVKSRVFANKSTAEICENLRTKVFLRAEEMDIHEICSRLEMTRSELLDRFKTSEEFLTANKLDKRVKVLQRCLHVFEEADRVEQFKHICDTSKDLDQLGRLMRESHESLKVQYECSHVELDLLVEVALEHGAKGARLTGAGWGGCIVILVDSSTCQQVEEALSLATRLNYQTGPRSGCTIIRL